MCCGIGGGCDACDLADDGECLGAFLRIWYSDDDGDESSFFSGEGEDSEMPEVGEVLIPESWKAVLPAALAAPAVCCAAAAPVAEVALIGLGCTG